MKIGDRFTQTLANFLSENNLLNMAELNEAEYEVRKAYRDFKRNFEIDYCKWMIEQIKPFLESALPSDTTLKMVVGFAPIDRKAQVQILWASEAQGIHINSNDCVSFSLSYLWELDVQIYGGTGGRCITRKIDPNNPEEKNWACKSEPISFRKPKTEQKNVIDALVKFAQRWVEKKAEIETRGLTR